MPNGILQQKINAGLQDHPAWIGRHTTIDHLRPGIVRTVQAHPELSPVLQQIKETAIANLDQLLPQAIAAMEQRGFQVYLAEDNQEAADYCQSGGRGVGSQIQDQHRKRNCRHQPFAAARRHRLRNRPG